ncbi:putative uncharacterized protein [Eubacterium sp. CAG:192]|nr:putative uncharacterized protein [Eubacterium sp. CAG:192]
MGKKYNQLSREDRIQIEALYESGMKAVKIAEQLGYHYSTIYRELKRGKTVRRNRSDWSEKEIYSYDKGQIKYEENKRKCGRKKIMHEKDEEFIEYVEMMISDYHYSPAAIMEEIKRDGMEYKTKICLTTFYNYIKAGVFPNIVLADLPYRRKKKIKRKQKVQKRFSKGTSIDKRPKEIETREEIGHWEMDSVVGPQGEGEKTLLVLTERKTRKEIIRLLNNHTSEEVVKALNRIERDLGEKKFRETFKSITVDNGTEFSDWEGMERSRRNKKRKRTKIYYCHAYRSCERGSNENLNRMIRRWFPKGTNFDDVSKLEVQKVENWINQYPREILGWKSSDEMYKLEQAI